MATKRPSNGVDLSFRHSNMRKQHLKYTAHLSQAEADRERKASLVEKLEREQTAKKELKMKLKEQARLLDTELGFVEPVVELNWRHMPEWKKQKSFLAKVFVPPAVCVKYKSQFVFKNRLSMKGLNRGLCSDADWAANVQLLEVMRREYDLEEEEKCKQEETRELAECATNAAVPQPVDDLQIENNNEDNYYFPEQSDITASLLDRTIFVHNNGTSTNSSTSTNEGSVQERDSIGCDEIVSNDHLQATLGDVENVIIDLLQETTIDCHTIASIVNNDESL